MQKVQNIMFQHFFDTMNYKNKINLSKKILIDFGYGRVEY